jgi:hypothetical protein
LATAHCPFENANRACRRLTVLDLSATYCADGPGLTAEDHFHRLTGYPHETDFVVSRLAGQDLEAPGQQLNRLLDGAPETNGLIGRGLLLVEIIRRHPFDRRELFDADGFVSVRDGLNANNLFYANRGPSGNDRNRFVQPIVRPSERNKQRRQLSHGEAPIRPPADERHASRSGRRDDQHSDNDCVHRNPELDASGAESKANTATSKQDTFRLFKTSLT